MSHIRLSLLRGPGDEDVDRQVVGRLRLDSHQVGYVAEMSPGVMDEAVLAESRKFSERIDHG